MCIYIYIHHIMYITSSLYTYCLRVCVCICIYVYTYIYILIYIYTCMIVYANIHTYILKKCKETKPFSIATPSVPWQATLP